MTSKQTDPELGGEVSQRQKGSIFGFLQLINVGVENSVDEADARAFVRVLIRQLDMDFPVTTSERSY
jgi:hypothetical protein